MSFTPIVTIAANNYLAFARVLAESYRQHHPGTEVFVCLVDQPHSDVSYSQLPFKTIFVDELDIPSFQNLAFSCELLELSTAIKPYLLKHLRDRLGLERVYYFDPDILICDRLTDLDAALDSHSLVLTPHLTEPLDSENKPSEAGIRPTGVYDPGFLGIQLNDETRDFLRWWQDRLQRFCGVDPTRGLFVNQSWLDFAPAYLDRAGIVRDPIYDIAYWNLAQRHPERTNGRWTVNGRNVGFFHFSGVDLEDLGVVSRHQDRIKPKGRPELTRLFEHYRDLLLAADHERLSQIRSRYDYFYPTAIRIPKPARRILRDIDPQGRRWADPFDLSASDSYLQWLIEPVRYTGGRLNRISLGLWEQRSDLKTAFPEVRGKHLANYVEWLSRENGSEKSGLHPFFVEGLRATPTAVGALTPLDPSMHAFDPSHMSTAIESIDFSAPGKQTSWLTQPAAGSGGGSPMITNAALLVYLARSDLQEVFPDPLGRDRLQFAYWFVGRGPARHRLHPSLVSPVLWSLPSRTRIKVIARAVTLRLQHLLDALRRRSPRSMFSVRGPTADSERAEVSDGTPGTARGVNLAGYFSAKTGVGRMGRASAAVLRHAGFPVAQVALDHMGSDDPSDRLNYPGEGFPYSVTLFNANADVLPTVFSRLPMVGLARNYKIGYWYWELSHFPLRFADRFQLLDEVWAPTDFCRKSFEAVSTIPIHHVPPHVPPPPQTFTDRRRFGLDVDRFYFFFAFDVLSVPERKNPSAAIAALRQLTHRTKRRVGLVLKVSEAHRAADVMSRLRSEADGLPVVFITQMLSRPEMDQLLASTDAVLSLHRSEGFGLLPLEGLYLDKPVVATGYGGVTDFLDHETGFPVAFELRQLWENYGPYPKASIWAEPSVQNAVEQMQRILEDPEEAKRRTAAGKKRIETIYSLDSAAERFKAELRRISKTLEG